MLCEKLDHLAELLGYRPTDRQILSLSSNSKNPEVKELAEELSEGLGLEVGTYIHRDYDKWKGK